MLFIFSFVAKSNLVIAIIKLSIDEYSMTLKCSIVWLHTPSIADTTSIDIFELSIPHIVFFK